jgi:hypothetical protein
MNAAAPNARDSDGPGSDGRAELRRRIYGLLVVLGLAAVAGRILAVDAVDSRRLEEYLYHHEHRADWQKRLPLLSANDRSRWCTIRSLVEHGTYAIDAIINEPNWDTIDAVKHDEFGRAAPAADQGRVYSSKPPLLATLLAGEYWLIYRFTPYSLGTHPFGVARAMLLTINLPLLATLWLLVARHVERYGRTDWGRLFVVAAAVFGMLLTTFAVSLTNHLVAATFAMIALDGMVRITAEGDLRPWRFAQVGFAAAFAAANELPALSLFALAGAWLLWKFPRPTLTAFAPAALVVAAASFGTNYAAHGTWVPPYGQRAEGNNWYAYQYLRNGRVRDSYWSAAGKRSEVDLGEPSSARYAFHALVGHHGIFSLTPIWLLTVVGLAATLRDRASPLRTVAAGVAVTSLVCIAFYLTRPQLDRNYGGTSAGFRWVFWFAPLWLVGMLPAADAAAERRIARGLCLLLLAASVVSVAYPTWNPWLQPWLADAWDALK